MSIPKYYLTILMILISCPAFTQALHVYDYHSVTKYALSPNAASLGKYGEIPVDLFTGTPDINIPLSTVNYGPINIPIKLSYDANGVKVNEIPGWAGLNWNLLCGGSISRKVNYIQDEFNNPNPNLGPATDQGYYFKGNLLNTSQWHSINFMKTVLNNYNSISYGYWQGLAFDGEPDEFQFQFGNYSGSFYRSETGEWKVKSKQEFKLEISSDISSDASYLLYRNGSTVATYAEPIASLFTKFTIIAPDGFKYIFGGDQSAIEFSRGQITGPSGSENFPRPHVQDRRNYITANTWYLTKIIAPTGETIVFNYKRGKAIYKKYRYYIPGYIDEPGMTWSALPAQKMGGIAINPCYLESVETPWARWDFITSTAVELDFMEGLMGTTPNEFKKTLTTYYRDLASDAPIPDALTLPHYNQQLDSIKFFDKRQDKYIYGFKLYQSADTQKRRTLDSIEVIDFDDNMNNSKYKFSYLNNISLPYETLARDHYGLYNSSWDPPAIENASDLPTRYPNTSAITGLISKIVYPTGGETDFEFEAGHYGGAIKFDPNSTQPVQLLNETGIASVRIKKITSKGNFNAPPVTKEYFYIKDYATNGTVSSGILSMKLPVGNQGYLDMIDYNINWGGLIFLGTIPECNGSFSAANNSDNNSEWLSMVHGGIITYSEVAEKSGDGSFKVFKFTNSDDPQYRDEIHDNYAYADAGWTGSVIMGIITNSNFRISSNDLERGKILSEEDYDNSGNIVRKLEYAYENDPQRKNDFVKAFAHKELFTTKACGNFCLGSVPRGWTYKIYCYKNPLKKLTETQYGNSAAVSRSSTFTYDAYGNIASTTTTTSDKRINIEHTSYNSDPVYLSGAATTPAAQGIRNLFTVFHIKNYPVEKTTFISPDPDYGAVDITQINCTGGTLYQYDPGNPMVTKVLQMELAEPFPQTIVSGSFWISNLTSSSIQNGDLVFDSRYKEQEHIVPYTHNNSDRPAAVTDKSGVTAYTWDLAGEKMTSVTRGAQQNEAAYCGFEGDAYLPQGSPDDNKGNWSFYPASITTTGFTGHQSLSYASPAPNAIPFAFLSSSFVIPSGKAYQLSFWSNGSLPQVRNGNTALPTPVAVKTVNDWSLYVYEITGTGQAINLFPPTTQSVTLYGKVDDIRLIPEGSGMKSYTYDPATGSMLASIDERNRVSFYTYDNLGRLILIKDEDGHILKKLDYHVRN